MLKRINHLRTIYQKQKFMAAVANLPKMIGLRSNLAVVLGKEN
jgi:hypothetical protein